MSRKRGWREIIGKSTFDKRELHKKVLELKRCFDEVSGLLDGLDKNKKNR